MHVNAGAPLAGTRRLAAAVAAKHALPPLPSRRKCRHNSKSPVPASSATPSMRAAKNLDAEMIRELAAGRLVVPASQITLPTTSSPPSVAAPSRSSQHRPPTSAPPSTGNRQDELAIDHGPTPSWTSAPARTLTKPAAFSPNARHVRHRPHLRSHRRCDVEDVDYDTILSVIEKQAHQGVDFFTIHAGTLREHVELTAGRVCGIVRRCTAGNGCSTTANRAPCEVFDDICGIMR